MIKTFLVTFVLFFEFICFGADISAYSKIYSILQKKASLSHNEIMFINQNRLDFSSESTRNFSYEISYELGLFHSVPRDFNQKDIMSNRDTYRHKDLKPISLNSKNKRSFLYQNLDRVNINYQLFDFELKAGRQAISYGIGYMVNPTNIIPRTSFSIVSSEHGWGVDALRLTYYPTATSEIELTRLFGKTDNTGPFISRGKFTLLNQEIELLGGYFYKNLLLGANIATSLSGIGLNIEFSHIKPKKEISYQQLNLSLLYQLPYGLSVSNSYFFNSLGKFSHNIKKKHFAYRKGGLYLQGSHYFFAGIEQMVNMIFNWGFRTMISLEKKDALFISSCEYNLNENSYLDIGFITSYSFFSDKSNREFYLYPQQIYSGFKYYF